MLECVHALRPCPDRRRSGRRPWMTRRRLVMAVSAVPVDLVAPAPPIGLVEPRPATTTSACAGTTTASRIWRGTACTATPPDRDHDGDRGGRRRSPAVGRPHCSVTARARGAGWQRLGVGRELGVVGRHGGCGVPGRCQRKYWRVTRRHDTRAAPPAAVGACPRRRCLGEGPGVCSAATAASTASPSRASTYRQLIVRQPAEPNWPASQAPCDCERAIAVSRAANFMRSVCSRWATRTSKSAMRESRRRITPETVSRAS